MIVRFSSDSSRYWFGMSMTRTVPAGSLCWNFPRVSPSEI
jgi:hypothetical protein